MLLPLFLLWCDRLGFHSKPAPFHQCFNSMTAVPELAALQSIPDVQNACFILSVSLFPPPDLRAFQVLDSEVKALWGPDPPLPIITSLIHEVRACVCMGACACVCFAHVPDLYLIDDFWRQFDYVAHAFLQAPAFLSTLSSILACLISSFLYLSS
jgi:hypothetical protein